jgi:tetratricopeptide (TPR) repeat protein
LFQTFALTYPRDFVALSGDALSLSYLGRREEALSKFIEALPQRPGAFVAYANAAEAYLALGRFQAAKQYTNKLREMGFDDVADYIDSFADFLQGNYDHAVHALKGMTQNPSPMWQNDAHALLASILSEMGRLEEAQRTLAEGISLDLSAGRVHSAAEKHLAMAYIHYRSGREHDC